MPLIREEIKVAKAFAPKIVEPGYGYLRVSQFQDPTVADLAGKITELYKAGPVKGIVLDLRNNPGGVLPGAIGVSAAFLPKDSLIVSTRGQIQEAQGQVLRSARRVSARRRRRVARPAGCHPRRADGGARQRRFRVGLRDRPPVRCRTTSALKIVGTTTFGKGSVQTILPLPPERKTTASS